MYGVCDCCKKGGPLNPRTHKVEQNKITWLCDYCAYGGELIEKGQESFEHFIPHSHGGITDFTNFLYVCREHNNLRRNMDFNEFLQSGLIAPYEVILQNIANSLREFKGIKINGREYTPIIKNRIERKIGRKLDLNG